MKECGSLGMPCISKQFTTDFMKHSMRYVWSFSVIITSERLRRGNSVFMQLQAHTLTFALEIIATLKTSVFKKRATFSDTIFRDPVMFGG